METPDDITGLFNDNRAAEREAANQEARRLESEYELNYLVEGWDHPKPEHINLVGKDAAWNNLQDHLRENRPLLNDMPEWKANYAEMDQAAHRANEAERDATTRPKLFDQDSRENRALDAADTADDLRREHEAAQAKELTDRAHGREPSVEDRARAAEAQERFANHLEENRHLLRNDSEWSHYYDREDARHQAAMEKDGKDVDPAFTGIIRDEREEQAQEKEEDSFKHLRPPGQERDRDEGHER